MHRWKDVLISPEVTIYEAIGIIDKGRLQVALVIDENGRLKGIVTDGDIRRAILKNIAVDQSIEKIMTKNPLAVDLNASDEEIRRLMMEKSVWHVPVVDQLGCCVGLKIFEDLVLDSKKNMPVVLMAGGLGSRLAPLTDHCPKPLLEINGKPVLELIINFFHQYGFENFYVSINYKGKMIEKYFADGSDFGVRIEYLREERRLGTAGSLSLLPDDIDKPCFVMNGDVLTTTNLNNMLDFHMHHEADATMAVRKYDFQIPYGVVEISENYSIQAINEKPMHSFFVNAGIYILSPKAIRLVPKDTYFEMTSLFNLLVAQKMIAVSFPLRERWIDMGNIDDYNRAIIEDQQLSWARSVCESH